MALDSMQISLPPLLRQFVEKRVTEGGFNSPNEYFGELVRKDQERQALWLPDWDQIKRDAKALTIRSPEHLESLLLEGIESIERDRLDPEEWDAFIAKLEQDIDALPVTP